MGLAMLLQIKIGLPVASITLTEEIKSPPKPSHFKFQKKNNTLRF